MLDIEEMKAYLAEQYGIHSDVDLKNALMNGGLNIGIFTQQQIEIESEKSA